MLRLLVEIAGVHFADSFEIVELNAICCLVRHGVSCLEARRFTANRRLRKALEAAILA